MTVTEGDLSEPKRTAHAWVDDHRNWLSRTTTDDLGLPRAGLARVPVGGARTCGCSASSGSRSRRAPPACRRRSGRASASGRPVLGAVRRVRRRAGQQPGGRAVPTAARGRARAGGRSHRPALRCSARARSAGCWLRRRRMERHGLGGTLVFFGEPAEKVCGSKPDPCRARATTTTSTPRSASTPPGCPRTRTPSYWDTHCGSYWSARLHLRVPRAGEAGRPPARAERSNPPHVGPRAGRDRRGRPDVHELEGAQGGHAPAHRHVDGQRGDPRRGRRRRPTTSRRASRRSSTRAARRPLEMQERVYDVLDRNAEHAAAMTQLQRAQGLGVEDAAGPAEPCARRALLRESRACRAARSGTTRPARSAARSSAASDLCPDGRSDPAPACRGCSRRRSYEAQVRAEIPPGRRTTPPTTTPSTRGMRRPPASTSAAACCDVPSRDVDYPAWVFNATRRPPGHDRPHRRLCRRGRSAATLVDLLTRPDDPASARRPSSASAPAAASAARPGSRRCCRRTSRRRSTTAGPSTSRRRAARSGGSRLGA